MYKLLSMLIVCALMLGLSGAPVQAEDAEMEPAAGVQGVQWQNMITEIKR